VANHDAELERLKAQIESQRLEIERDRQAREQRNHELQLKMLDALGGRSNQASPSLTELISGVETLRNLSGNGGGVAGFNEVLEIADRINALRGNSTEDDSWIALLKSVGPGVAQAVIQVLGARNGSLPGGAGASNIDPQAAKPDQVSGTEPTAPLPTAYDQIAGQLRGLLERLQVQVRAGLDPAMAVETLLTLEASSDPIASLVLNGIEKSPTFDSWLTWLRSQIGQDVVIEQDTLVFLSKVFTTAKSLPNDPSETEGQ
jgi:hypothetical protein